MNYLCCETKGADQLCSKCGFAVNAKLICAFVFAYADCWFSHAAAHLEKALSLIYCVLYMHVHVHKQFSVNTSQMATLFARN